MYKRKEKKQSIKNDRVLDGIVSRTLSDLVEARGVEPLSEKHSYTLSPGADGF